jgi:hypothetical protein
MWHSAVSNLEAQARTFTSVAIVSVIAFLSCKSIAETFLSYVLKFSSNAVPQAVVDATERFRQRIADINLNVCSLTLSSIALFVVGCGSLADQKR